MAINRKVRRALDKASDLIVSGKVPLRNVRRMTGLSPATLMAAVSKAGKGTPLESALKQTMRSKRARVHKWR